MNLSLYITLIFSFYSPCSFISGSKGNKNSTSIHQTRIDENEMKDKKEKFSTERINAHHSRHYTCNTLKGLSAGQLKHCHLYEDHVKTVTDGVRVSLSECEKQFKYQRWNCSLDLEHTTFFGPTFKNGNKEASYLQAITSAGIMHAVAKSCKEGQLSRCGCSTLPRPRDLHKDWLWRGCSDNLEYAYKFTRNLVDIKEQEKVHRLRIRDEEYSYALMNLHNNEAGRRAVLKRTKIICKCHGVSGSCSLITCWHQLPIFSEIGDYIARKYKSAVKVKQNKKGRLQVRNTSAKRSTVTDLVYLQASPNFCKPNETYGVLGTQSRECFIKSDQPGNCEELCCGRGYNVQKVFAKKKCNCKFQWCCYVKCDQCTLPAELTTCK